MSWLPSSTPGRLKQTHKQDPQRLTDTNWQQRSPNSCAKLGSVTSFTYNLSVVTAFSVSSKEEREGRIADRKRELREELNDLNVDKRMLKMKDLNERQRQQMGENTWMEKKGKKEGRNIFLPVVDMVSAAAIRVRKTHQRFVCSVRVN